MLGCVGGCPAAGCSGWNIDHDIVALVGRVLVPAAPFGGCGGTRRGRWGGCRTRCWVLRVQALSLFLMANGSPAAAVAVVGGLVVGPAWSADCHVHPCGVCGQRRRVGGVLPVC